MALALTGFVFERWELMIEDVTDLNDDPGGSLGGAVSVTVVDGQHLAPDQDLAPVPSCGCNPGRGRW